MSKFGWKGDIPDSRDYPYKTIAKAVEQPDVYYGWHEIPIRDQGDLGSCGPHSAVSHLNAVIVQNKMFEASWYHLSSLALYYFYREFTGEVNEDSGVYNRVMLQVMQQKGVPREELWPYDLGKWKTKPPPEVYADAAKRQIPESSKEVKMPYYLVTGIDEFLQAIAEGYGFLGGIPVYESFMDTGPSGIVPMPKGKFLGGHDIYFHSYDKHRQLIGFQNSWGNTWGKEGHGWLPFEFAATMLSACYTVRILEG